MGHIAIFSPISEFRNPKEFTKALYLLQFTDTTMYIVVTIVIYRYSGDFVTSPALDSASDVRIKIAYGLRCRL
ncbi:hypothetical protein CC78DRAFT_534974 [Lojkania enalia]|uniref:Uncharacterized protein n=1 Tax=Lojkania enalia TaxID=147567 RepID=A0A9P4K609_9PLEO|nr:hypothetical protein CC78DRAFT_534974 [Didymosphaeria enalia]